MAGGMSKVKAQGPQRPAQVEDEMNNVYQALDDQLNLVENIEAGLVAVLRVKQEEIAPGVTKDPAARVPLAVRLNEVALRIEANNQRLVSVLDRLEL